MIRRSLVSALCAFAMALPCRAQTPTVTPTVAPTPTSGIRLILRGGSGLPGAEVEVTISLAGSLDQAATVDLRVLFDEGMFSITPETDCVIDPRLNTHILSASPRGGGLVRIAVLDTLPPVETLSDGRLVKCVVRIADDAVVGPVSLRPERVQLADASGYVLCGVGSDVPCTVEGGTIEVLCSGGCVCPGDCNSDGHVTVNELIEGIDIALGRKSLMTNCGSADRNGDGMVTVDELVEAVTAAMRGCPAAP